MTETQKSIPRYTGIAWGLLLILWGFTILFDFIPFGVGLVGTGLIFLGANRVRARNHLPAHPANTIPGILALTWGGLELARPVLHQLLGAVDLDWAIFAIMLVVLGLTLLGRELFRTRQASIQSSR